MSLDAAKWAAVGALVGVSVTLAMVRPATRPATTTSTPHTTRTTNTIAGTTNTTTGTTNTTTNTTAIPNTPTTPALTTDAPTPITLPIPSQRATRVTSFSYSPTIRPQDHPQHHQQPHQQQQHFTVVPFFRKGKMRLHIHEGPEAYRMCMRPYLNSLPLPKYLLSLIWGTNRLARLAKAQPKYFRFVGEFLIAPSNNLEEMLLKQPDVTQWTQEELSANFRYIIWWIHPEYHHYVQAWLPSSCSDRVFDHSDSLPEPPPLSRADTTTFDSTPSIIPKHPGYLHCCRDLQPSHIEPLLDVQSHVQQMFQQLANVQPEQVKMFFQYPNHPTATTLHIKATLSDSRPRTNWKAQQDMINDSRQYTMEEVLALLAAERQRRHQLRVSSILTINSEGLVNSRHFFEELNLSRWAMFTQHQRQAGYEMPLVHFARFPIHELWGALANFEGAVMVEGEPAVAAGLSSKVLEFLEKLKVSNLVGWSEEGGADADPLDGAIAKEEQTWLALLRTPPP